MWQNYSQWLLDARSRFEQSSAISRARQAAAGMRVLGSSVGERKAQEEFTSKEKDLRQGYTYTTLAEARFPVRAFGVRRRNVSESMRLLSGPEDVPTRTARVGSRDGPLTREDLQQDRISTVKIPLYKDFNITKDQYAQQFNRFTKLFGRNPDRVEMYYALKYGFPGKPSDAPTKEDKATTRAKQAAGFASRTAVIGAKLKDEEEEKSPWV